MQIQLAEQMREFRRRDGRTQEDLAQALGVTSQAVSRWEKGICYPDMGLIPSLANYFGVSIDELFGYNNERSKKVNALAKRINDMNRENNGVDVCMDDCIQLAREALAEFPSNETLMLCLAGALYNAGYVRYGEHHFTNEDGYDVYDVEKHRSYDEWKEAIKLYEQCLRTLEEGELRHQAVRELMQLYLNTGEYDKAKGIAQTAPDLSGCRELLRLKTVDGQKRAEAIGETLLELLSACSDLMIAAVETNSHHMEPAVAVRFIENAIGIFDLVCIDGDYGLYDSLIARLHLYLSEQQWRAGKRDDAFQSLDRARKLAKRFESRSGDTANTYSSPLLKTVKINPRGYEWSGVVARLPEDWPWVCVPDCRDVKVQIQADPRWNDWVTRTQNES